jgi:hypothetical protein
VTEGVGVGGAGLAVGSSESVGARGVEVGEEVKEKMADRVPRELPVVVEVEEGSEEGVA